MKDIIKSALKTFLPTLFYVGSGWLIGVLLVKGLIFLLEGFGTTTTSIVVFGLFFLIMWIINAVSKYQIKKDEDRIEREYEEFKAKLEKLK